VIAHAQKPDSVFQRNGRVHLYRRGCQFSQVLAFLVCGSGENDCSNTGWTVPSQTEDCLATHSIRLFPLHFSSRASPCATRFRFHSTTEPSPYSSLLLKQLRVPPTVKKFPSYYGTPSVHYRVHNSPPLVPILSKINPVHVLPSHISPPPPNFF